MRDIQLFIITSLCAIIVITLTAVRDDIRQSAITIEEYDQMREDLIISQALVRKCAENDTIDIMQYVRDVKREMKNN